MFNRVAGKYEVMKCRRQLLELQPYRLRLNWVPCLANWEVMCL